MTTDDAGARPGATPGATPRPTTTRKDAATDSAAAEAGTRCGRCAHSAGECARLQSDFIVGSSNAMSLLKTTICRVAGSRRPVLVTGPTGSGKELAVRAIHEWGTAADQPLLDLNCGAIPANLIESELFGHERGAFTGADRKKDGFLTVVGEGTLFLDEIAELPASLQASLLRVLETGIYRPVGSTESRLFRGRIVAATHADLATRVAERSFREDLYYRLQVLQVRVPALDEHKSDIPALVEHFLQKESSGHPLRVTDDAMRLLVETSWPGNVRQLRNAISRIAVFTDGPLIDAAAVRPHVAALLSAPSTVSANLGRDTAEPTRARLYSVGAGAAGLFDPAGAAFGEDFDSADPAGFASLPDMAYHGDLQVVAGADPLSNPRTLAAAFEATPPIRTMARWILSLPVADKLQAIEDALIEEAMAQADGCKAEAARLLGVHRKSVHRRVSELGTPNRSIPS